MQFKDVAASVVLGLLFTSLLAIYLVTDQNPLVTGLSIIIIAICLIIVRVGDWREIGIIGTVSAVVSIVAAYLVGQDQFGRFGSILFPLVWALVVLGIFSWVSANIQRVPSDRAILSVRTFSGEVINQPPPLAIPILPFLEKTLATIPLYRLSTDCVVKDINTQTKNNVGEIHVHVEYEIAQRETAPRAMAGIPNRGLIQTRIAKEMNKSVDEARTDVQFWERLLDGQMKEEVDDVVRTVIRDLVKGPVEAHRNLKPLQIEEHLFKQLNRRVESWGVNVTHLVIDKVVVSGEAWRDPVKELELEARKRLIDYERVRNLRNAQHDAEAERVRKLIEAVREAGIDNIPPALLEDIIVSASAADPGDRVLDMELNRWFNDNYKSPPGSGGDGGKK